MIRLKGSISKKAILVNNVDFLYREGEEYLPCIMNNCVTVNENNSSMEKTFNLN